MAVPDIANFFGSITLQATVGCTLQFNAVLDISLSRIDKDAMTATINFTSDGAITDVVWDESGSGPTTIQGLNAVVTLPSGFNLDANEWNANIEVDRVTWNSFATFQENNKVGNSRITGTIVGLVQFDAANTEPFATV